MNVAQMLHELSRAGWKVTLSSYHASGGDLRWRLEIDLEDRYGRGPITYEGTLERIVQAAWAGEPGVRS